MCNSHSKLKSWSAQEMPQTPSSNDARAPEAQQWAEGLATQFPTNSQWLHLFSSTVQSEQLQEGASLGPHCIRWGSRLSPWASYVKSSRELHLFKSDCCLRCCPLKLCCKVSAAPPWKFLWLSLVLDHHPCEHAKHTSFELHFLSKCQCTSFLVPCVFDTL